MNFLCDFHRQQLRLCPAAATRRWQAWLETGAERFRDRNWPEALKLLGSAYETGRLLLDSQALPFAEGDLTGFDRMMIAGHYLAECLGRMCRVEAERQVLTAVHHDLLAAVDNDAVDPGIRARLRYNLAISLQLLDRHYRLSRARLPNGNDIADFARLYRQTQARLQFCASAALH